MLYPARSILAIDTSPFGQSLAMLPVTRALRASYPKTLLVAAASSGTCELLTADGLVDETISLGVVKHSDHGRPGGLKRLLGLARRTRRYSFDVVLDFSPSLEALVVSRLVMRARVFTPSRLTRIISILLDPRGTSNSAGPAARSDYENVLQQVGVQINDPRLAITSSVEEDARFEHRLASSGSRGGELIVLLYASNPESRRSWPVDSFGEIGTRLANNFNARIVAGDEPSDDAFSQALSTLLPPGAIKLAEPRALELIAAIARASLVITDEPAIAQIALELSTPVIEIADASSSMAAASTAHRIAQGSSRSRVSPEAVYEIAGEMIQENRSPSLFQRP
jgi:ADP-heptose:LPS heptosyltransferase